MKRETLEKMRGLYKESKELRNMSSVWNVSFEN